MPAQIERFYGIPQGDSFTRRMMHKNYCVHRNDFKKDLKLLQCGYDKGQGQRHDTRVANWCIVGSKEGEYLVSGGASEEGPMSRLSQQHCVGMSSIACAAAPVPATMAPPLSSSSVSPSHVLDFFFRR
jgi:hypothetical protein